MPPEDLSPALSVTDPLHASSLARQVLASLQARGGRDASAPTPDPARLDDLVAAVVDPAPFDAAAVIGDLVGHGVSDADLSDVLVPCAARHLGTCWCESEMSFSSVTVAAGRLQEMLGVLSRADDLLPAAGRPGPGILVLSMRGDDHTLGWKVVGVQLRRRGYAPHSAPGVTAEEGAALIAQAPYDLVLVSASRLDAVARVKRMAEVLRARMADVPPIVLGGLVCQKIGDADDLPDLVAVTNSLEDALRHRRRRSPHPCEARR